ncbi:nuclear transport factor 2 family protein [Gramella sp. BOM4]|nr:nuclear transport factor 2 family protein [Christiangramia bathymodioli]
MKKLISYFVIFIFFCAGISAQENNSMNEAYILTEIWKAKPAWYELSKQEREKFFNDKINPVLMKTLQNGAEILGTAVNNNTGEEKMDYQFMAVWKFPDKKNSDELEKVAKEAGFLKYFDQVNFSGNLIPPPSLNERMVALTEDSKVSGDLESSIQKNFQKMGQAMANSDPELLSTFFTEDAVLKFPGLDPLKGREAIAEHHGMMIEQGISVIPKTTEVEKIGNTGYEIGTYQLINEDGQELDSGTYASIWKKVNGEWKLYRDVVSSSNSQLDN